MFVVVAIHMSGRYEKKRYRRKSQFRRYREKKRKWRCRLSFSFFVEEIGEYVRQWDLFEFLFTEMVERVAFFIVFVQVINASSLWIRNND